MPKKQKKIEEWTGISQPAPVAGSSKQEAKEGGSGGEKGEEDDCFIVESIVGKDGRGDTAMYRVRWKGYAKEEDTWEPRKSLVSGRVSF